MVQVRKLPRPENAADVVAARIAILKARLRHAPAPWHRVEDRRDWTEIVRPEVAALVGEAEASHLIRETVEEESAAARLWTTQRVVLR